MLPSLLIHPATQKVLDAYLAKPPHAILLTGPVGIGKFTIAVAWAKQLTNTAQVIAPDEKGTISIETIRQLYRNTRARQASRQVVIVDHAEAMGHEAQNALLKLLEEPRQGTIFVLCTPHSNSLLPTIISRTQQVTVHPSTNKALEPLLKDNPQPAQALFIARGRPAILSQLASNPSRLEEASQQMRLAKLLISASQYNRLASIGRLASNRESCIATLDAMLHMVSLQIKNPKNTLDQTKSWLAHESALETCLTQLQGNGNPRAQLLRLFASY